MRKIFSSIQYMDKKRIQYTCMEFLSWATLAAISFNVVLLREKGYKNTVIGTIMFVVAFSNIFAKPFWGVVSDRIRSVKKVYIFCMAISAVIYLLLPLTGSPLQTGLTLLVFNFFCSPLDPLLNSWIVHGTSNNKDMSYGAIRLWGSIGYAIMTYAYGKLINYRSVNIVFPAYFIMAVLTIILSIRIKDEEAAVQQITLKEMKFGKLFTNYYYVTFVLYAFFINIAIASSSTFLPNLVEHLRGSKEQLGMMFSIRALCEIPILFFGRQLIRIFGPVKLTIFAGVLYISQQFAYLMAINPLQVILGHIIGGPAYSLFLLGMIHYVHILAPDELKATAQTFTSAFSMGLGSMVGNYLGGILVDYLGLHWLYRLGILNNFLAVTLFVLSFLLKKYRISIKSKSSCYPPYSANNYKFAKDKDVRFLKKSAQ
ncbi:MAG: transporter, family, 3-phenylpropionic acid transporter [Clostridiales bacterium]|nr:transporter, family, 3-phenylpropionic acid transporter [Clostridiales bacterium]